MKLYTKTGDKGTTSLVGGTRVPKTDPRIEAYGTVDELSANIGYLYDISTNPLREHFITILNNLMACSALLAAEDQTIPKLPKISEDDITEIEKWTDNLMENLPKLHNFTLPVGDIQLSHSHICRTVCRRAERRIITARDINPEIPESVSIYINRLSDYLYAFGRNTVHLNNVKEIEWRPKK